MNYFFKIPHNSNVSIQDPGSPTPKKIAINTKKYINDECRHLKCHGANIKVGYVRFKKYSYASINYEPNGNYINDVSFDTMVNIILSSFKI